MANERDYSLNQTGPKVQQLLDAIQPPIQTVQPAGGMLPNMVYRFGVLEEDTVFDTSASSETSIPNSYFFTFETGATVPNIQLPVIRGWNKDDVPVFEPNTYYEIYIIDGIGSYVAAGLTVQAN